MPECLIIGGGVIGMMTALELTRKGIDVQLIERGSTGQESSWAGGGILSPLYPWRYPDPVNALANWGQQHYASYFNQLHTETGIDPEYQQSGFLIIDTHNESEAALRWTKRYNRKLEILQGAQIRECEPNYHCNDNTRAFWLPEVGQVRNPRLSKSVRQAVLQNGGKISENTPATGLDIQNGRVRGVKTIDGVLHADQVVVCAGAWSAVFLKSIQIEIAVEPVRGQMLLLRAEPGLLQHILMHNGRYLIPRQDGHILVGSTTEQVGFDKSTTEEAFEDLHCAALTMLPLLKNYPVEKHWAGLRPGSPHHTPYIGQHPHVQGLYLNTGHFRNGIVLSLASTRLLAELMTGEKTPILSAEPFSFESVNAGLEISY